MRVSDKMTSIRCCGVTEVDQMAARVSALSLTSLRVPRFPIVSEEVARLMARGSWAANLALGNPAGQILG